MESGVWLGRVRVGRRSLVSWWVVHDPDAAKPRPTSVPIHVIRVRVELVGIIPTLDEILVRLTPSLNPRRYPI